MEHGQPSAYLIDVQDYEFMQRRLELLEGLSRGERAVLEGRTYSQSEDRAKMSKWPKQSGRSPPFRNCTPSLSTLLWITLLPQVLWSGKFSKR